MNVRGLLDKTKRRAIFDYYRTRADVICLQETHSTAEVEQQWCLEWGGRILFAHGNTSSRGVCVLFKKDFFMNITNVVADPEGRYIICELSVNWEDPKICLVNLYGPNKDTPQFIDNISELLSERSEHKILIGDYNFVQNVTMDRYGSTVNHKVSLARLQQCMNEYCLTDVWRDRNPDQLRFSWHRKNPKFTASRLDYALTSRGIDSMVENITYLSSFLTDHTAVYMSVSTNKNARGAGYWKLNNSLLESELNRTKIAKKICEIKKDIVSRATSANHTWTLFKKRISEYLKHLSRSIASDRKIAISNLSEKLNDLENQMPLDESTMHLYLDTKSDLEELQMTRAKGLIFRSKARWQELGEKTTKYFFNLEKCRSNQKTCSRIVNEDGNLLENDIDILQEQHRYYQMLYDADSSVKFDIENRNGIKITAEEKSYCEQQLTFEEVFSAITSLKHNKTPGPDGLTVEFYVHMWPHIKDIFMDMIRSCENGGDLDDNIKSGVLNLIPKPKKDARLLKNLRPITLLNVDYKIIEKVLAVKMDKILPGIIHSDQTGFMKKRRISVNIRKVYDILQHCKNENKPGTLLNLDFVKCFDRISFDSIMGSLKYFDFPSTFINWIQKLYTNFTIRVQNNGKFTDKIDVRRSVHQGGCISVQLFLLCAETIAIEIRDSKDIVGIFVNELEYLLNQYADDMNVASDHSESSISALFQKLEWFHKNTGFLLSYEKTSLFRMGSIHNTDAKCYTQREVAWTNDPISVLGIQVGYAQDIEQTTYRELNMKAQSVLSGWIHRNLSLLGKVTVVNTLVASLYVYRLSVLPSPGEQIVREFESIVNKFLWNGARPKIPMRTLQQSKTLGGVKLIDFKQKGHGYQNIMDGYPGRGSQSREFSLFLHKQHSKGRHMEVQPEQDSRKNYTISTK